MILVDESKNVMKKLICIIAFAPLLFACGANDNKNEVENYPTYDTLEGTEHINDSARRSMDSEGEIRHNVDSDQDGR